MPRICSEFLSVVFRIVFVHDQIVDFYSKIIGAVRFQAFHAVIANLVRVQIAAITFAAFDTFARFVKNAHTPFFHDKILLIQIKLSSVYIRTDV